MHVAAITYSLNGNNRNNFKLYQNKVNNAPKQVSFGSKPEVYEKLLEKFVELFNSVDESSIPAKLQDVRRAGDGTILNFKVQLQNGVQLAVNKFLPDKNKAKIPYIALKEFGPGAYREFVGLNLSTKELIYLEKPTAKPVYQFGEFKRVPVYDENHALYESRLDGWLSQIFADDLEAIGGSAGKSSKGSKGAKQNPKPKEYNQQTPVAPQVPVIPVKNADVPEIPVVKPVVATNDGLTEIQPNIANPAKNPPVVAESVKGDGVLPAKNNPPAQVKRYRTKTAGRVAGFINAEIQQDIKVINDIMDKLSKVREEHPSPFKRARLSDFKNNYPALVYTNARTNRGVTFKYGEGETLKANILERKPTKFLCIIHTDKAGDMDHILIESGDKIVVNTKPTDASFIPPKTIHCTKEEIKALPLAEYTKFLRENLEKYYADLSAVLESEEPIRITPKSNPVQDAVPAVKSNPAGSVSPVVKKEVPAEAPAAVSDSDNKVTSIPLVVGRSKFVPPLDSEELLSRINPDGLDEKLLAKINLQAAEDAKRYAQQYIDTFAKQFKKLVGDKIAEFQKMFGELFGNT